jgi:enamine deaminase RidA (YjgF/YER057c/UK114 family)
MSRTTVSSGSPYEDRIGFSRAVRVGNTIAVAGTAPIAPDGSTACPGDVYGQTLRCLEIMCRAVEDAGGHINDVIRTRILLTDISRWAEAAKAHGEVFADVKPACTFVQIAGLIHPEWLVETEADCVVAPSG